MYASVMVMHSLSQSVGNSAASHGGLIDSGLEHVRSHINIQYINRGLVKCAITAMTYQACPLFLTG